MPSLKRLIPACAIIACTIGVAASPALASTTQQAIIQDNPALQANPVQTLQDFKSLGASVVKVAVYWNSIAPNANSAKAPSGFKGTNPASYPAKNWAWLDTVVNTAKSDGLKVGFMVAGPTPKWAQGPGKPSGCNLCVWEPNASEFGQFVKALGTRYSGTYKPKGSKTALPRVSWWSIWNEPNNGSSLAPQTVKSGTVDSAAYMYRKLVAAAWTGLKGSGHTTSKDTILIGETAPRGTATTQNGTAWSSYKPGVFGGTMPLIFDSQLYCVGQNGKRLTGAAAKAEQCPSSAAQFKAQNPALFQASGFAIHPYAQGTPPNLPTFADGKGLFGFNATTKKSNPYYADFGAIPTVEKTLDKLQSDYGSSKKFLIWNTEFGYWSNPPDNGSALARREAVSPAIAAYYMNWAEYMSYTNPRIASYDQYMLIDTGSTAWNEGLLTSKGVKKPEWDAFQTPLYMPTTSASSNKSLTVWGGVRPAALAIGSLRPQAQLQFQANGKGSYKTLQTIKITNAHGYFDVHQQFPSSGNVRIAWSTPAAVSHTTTTGTTGTGTNATTQTAATSYSRVQKITIK
jgi:hypothetical protein